MPDPIEQPRLRLFYTDIYKPNGEIRRQAMGFGWAQDTELAYGHFKLDGIDFEGEGFDKFVVQR